MSNSKKKIVWILHEPSLSGANKVVAEILYNYHDLDIELELITPAFGAIGELAARNQVKVHTCYYRWWIHQGKYPSFRFYKIRNLLRNLLGAYDIAKVIKRTKPDLVITNTLTIISGALASYLKKTPHFWYIHEFGKLDHQLVFDLPPSISYYLINKLSKRIITNSKATCNYFGKYIPRQKLFKLYCPVNILPNRNKKLHKLDNNQIKLINVGQIASGKNQQDIIMAMELLKNKYPQLTLTILGPTSDQNYYNHLRQLVQYHNLGERVTFLPYTSTPFIVMEEHDIFVMPSISEAFGLVTIEAMLLELPIIARDSGANSELIKNGFNGYLYEPNNIPKLANHIENLVLDNSLRNKLGANGQTWAKNKFSFENFITEFSTLVKSINEG